MDPFTNTSSPHFTSENENPDNLTTFKILKRKQGRKKKNGKISLPENFKPTPIHVLFKREFEEHLEDLAQFINIKMNSGYEFFESEFNNGFKTLIKEFYDFKKIELTDEKLNFLYQIGRKPINKIYANKRHEVVKFWGYYFFLFSSVSSAEEIVTHLSSKNIPGRIIIYALLVVIFSLHISFINIFLE